MQKLFTLFLLLISLATRAQAPMYDWINAMRVGDLPDELNAEIYDFRTDPLGHTYLYGLLYDEVDFGNGIVLSPLAEDEEALFLAKFNPQGKPIWVKMITPPVGDPNGDFYSEAPGIAVDEQGGVYISGQLQAKSLDFGNGIILTNGCPQQACNNSFLAKYQADGEISWVKRIGTQDFLEVEASKLVTIGGALYMLADHFGFVDFGDGVQYSNLAPGVLLAKLSTDNSQTLWVRFIPTDQAGGYISGTLLSRGVDNDLWLSGSYRGTLEFGNGVILNTYGNSFVDNFIARYTVDGLPLQAYNLNAGYNYADVLDIAPVPTFGGLYVVADFGDTLRSGQDEVLISPKPYASTLLYLNSNGFSEVLSIPYQSDIYALSGVAAGDDGLYYVSGFTDESEVTIGDTTMLNAGCFDAYLAKGNLAGQVEWARMVGGEGCEAILGGYYGKSLGLSANGDLFTAGAYILDLSIDNVTQADAGLFVGKLKTGIVSTDDPRLALPLQVSPNPAAGTFFLTLPNDALSQSARLSLYDMQGRLLHERTLTEQVSAISVDLPNGVYTLRVQAGTRLAQEKLVVQQAP